MSRRGQGRKHLKAAVSEDLNHLSHSGSGLELLVLGSDVLQETKRWVKQEPDSAVDRQGEGSALRRLPGQRISRAPGFRPETELERKCALGCP